MIKYRLRSMRIDKIIDLAQAGLKEAVDVIVEQYYPMVIKISGKYYGEWAEHEDIVQNGLVGLLKAIYYYKKGKSSFLSFAWRSVESEIKSFLTYLNRMKNRLLTNAINIDSIFMDEESEEPGYMTPTPVTRDQKTALDEYLVESFLEEAKNILTELEFNIYRMRLEGYSYDEISKKLGIKWKAVDNNYQKAKKKLAPVLERYRYIFTYIKS